MSLNDRYNALGLESLEIGSAWKPTPHGQFLAIVISEKKLFSNRRVLELGAGVGNHTVPIMRQDPEYLLATELTEQDLAVTQRNVNKLLGPQKSIEFAVQDWLQLPDDLQHTFDIVVTNPPFCKSGKHYRRYFIDHLILDAHRALKSDGELLFIQSSMADLPRSFSYLKENGFQSINILDTLTGPFRDYYFDEPGFMEEISQIPNGFFQDSDGQYFETLSVVHATLGAR